MGWFNEAKRYRKERQVLEAMGQITELTRLINSTEGQMFQDYQQRLREDRAKLARKRYKLINELGELK